jgi:hypothetical protein
MASKPKKGKRRFEMSWRKMGQCYKSRVHLVATKTGEINAAI